MQVACAFSYSEVVTVDFKSIIISFHRYLLTALNSGIDYSDQGLTTALFAFFTVLKVYTVGYVAFHCAREVIALR